MKIESPEPYLFYQNGLGEVFFFDEKREMHGPFKDPIDAISNLDSSRQKEQLHRKAS